jgi:hypothetical protein
MKFIFNRKKQVSKIQERILRENGTERIELMEAFDFTKSTIQVSEIVSEADILYLNIESDVSVLLLDFKDAQDYRVLFLNKNGYCVGSTFALNNKNGFVIQTRYKKILLMRYAFHLKRIEPKVYVHPPSSNIKINILVTIKSTFGKKIYSKLLEDWHDFDTSYFMCGPSVTVLTSKDKEKHYFNIQKAFVKHEHELIGLKSRLFDHNIDNPDIKKNIMITVRFPWAAILFDALIENYDDVDIDKFMDTNYITVQTSKDNYFKTHYFWFVGRN